MAKLTAPVLLMPPGSIWSDASGRGPRTRGRRSGRAGVVGEASTDSSRLKWWVSPLGQVDVERVAAGGDGLGVRPELGLGRKPPSFARVVDHEAAARARSAAGVGRARSMVTQKPCGLVYVAVPQVMPNSSRNVNVYVIGVESSAGG